MALVRKLEPRQKEIRTVHEVTDCTYSVFVDDANNRYLQVDTYGSSRREIPGKVSQTIQLDEGAATQLRRIIDETFPVP